MLVLRHAYEPGAVTPPPAWLGDLGPSRIREVSTRREGEHVVVRVGMPGVTATPSTWWTIEDGWQAGLIAEWSPAALRRERVDLVTVPVLDRHNRTWPVPVVLEPLPGEGVALPVPLGEDWRPAPEPWQQRLIDACTWIRGEILRHVPDVVDGGAIGALSLGIDEARAAQATAEILATCTRSTVT